MAPRPFWKGYLKLSLVTCPVAMSPAVSDSERVRFHTLNRETGNRVESVYVDPATGKAVEKEDQAKGYQRADDDYIALDDDELDSVALECARTIDIELFAPRESIDWIWFDRAHYLTPDDAVGEEAFTVIRAAMAATGTVGIARLVLYRRERAILLQPRGPGMVLWTLRYGDEVRDSALYFDADAQDRDDKELMPLVTALIDKRTKAWDPGMMKDPVQDVLLKIVAAKRKGRPAPKVKAAAPEQTNVVSIMDALRKSIAAEEKRQKGR